MFSRLRGAMQGFWTPLARFLVRRGVSPDAVTIAGTVVVSALALTLLPTGHLLLGGLLIGLFVLTDSLDGVMARTSGRTGPWGAFLDSTLDRVSDAAVFVGITLWFVLHPEVPYSTWGTVAALACLALGSVVPYARARAEGVGATASVGIAERADRLFLALAGITFVPVGVPVLVAVVVLTLLAAASAVTIVQRVATVRRQLVTGSAAGPAGPPANHPANHPTEHPANHPANHPTDRPANHQEPEA